MVRAADVIVRPNSINVRILDVRPMMANASAMLIGGYLATVRFIDLEYQIISGPRGRVRQMWSD